MKVFIFFVAVFMASGCATKHFVDAKGRDCKSHWIYPAFVWDKCEETKEPLATTRSEINIDANINNK